MADFPLVEMIVSKARARRKRQPMHKFRSFLTVAGAQDVAPVSASKCCQ
jgi:hypothetical protein